MSSSDDDLDFAELDTVFEQRKADLNGAAVVDISHSDLQNRNIGPSSSTGSANAKISTFFKPTHSPGNKSSDTVSAVSKTATPSRSTKGTTQKGLYPRTHHELDYEACKTAIYPTNLPIRDYQYNIVQQALYKNVLCALPTGLGKTFIASAVMLNWYRWTKTAKIIFMAPTRPLVSQQLEACLGITGILRSDSCVLIGGSMQPAQRAAQWQEKRVFFATPQTVELDVKKGFVNPSDIALLVIDEAHRGVGKYAYTEVVNFISMHNKSFRILSLTATPASTTEGVQNILTNMKVSKAEIRTEESIDIQRYVHKRDIKKIQTEMIPVLEEILELFVETCNPIVTDLMKWNALYLGNGARSLNSYLVVQALVRFNATPAARDFRNPMTLKTRAYLKALIPLAGAMSLLKVHGIRQFYDKIMAFKKGATQDKLGKKKKPGKIAASILDNENFQEVTTRCEELLFTDGKPNTTFLGHDKLVKLVEEMNDFFADPATSPDSRVIVFVEFRESAAEVCRILANNCPMVKPRLFVGQQSTAKDKKEDEEIMVTYDIYGEQVSKGMNQKEQQKVIGEFKEGVHNTLICTSIGEEGLDIGQVDMIVTYDQSKSPIRILQRMGRTGRKRAGRIIMLLAEKEGDKLELAMRGYKHIQDTINAGKGGFVYEPINRILPDDCKPEIVKKEIEIPDENREILEGENTAKNLEKLQKSGKNKRQSRAVGKNKKDTLKAPARKYFMPENVETGFVKASALPQLSESSDESDGGIDGFGGLLNTSLISSNAEEVDPSRSSADNMDTSSFLSPSVDKSESPAKGNNGSQALVAPRLKHDQVSRSSPIRDCKREKTTTKAALSSSGTHSSPYPESGIDMRYKVFDPFDALDGLDDEEDVQIISHSSHAQRYIALNSEMAIGTPPDKLSFDGHSSSARKSGAVKRMHFDLSMDSSDDEEDEESTRFNKKKREGRILVE